LHRFDTMPACDERTDERTDAYMMAKMREAFCCHV